MASVVVLGTCKTLTSSSMNMGKMQFTDLCRESINSLRDQSQVTYKRITILNPKFKKLKIY